MARGHVCKRGNRFYIVYYIPSTGCGKGKQKWESGFATRQQAEITLSQRIMELGLGTFVEPTNLTLAEFMDTWARDKKAQVRPGTWRSYEWQVRAYIIPYLGHIKLRKLTPQIIQQFYSSLRNQPRLDGKDGVISERTLLHIHLVLNQALERAMRWGFIPRNSCKLVEKPRPRDSELVVWTMEQVRYFLEFTKDDVWHLIYLLLFTTGMRFGEILGLRWKDVNFAKQTVQIHQQLSFIKGGFSVQPPKSRAGRRTLDMNKEVMGELWEHKIRQETAGIISGMDLVNCTDKGKPIYPGNIRMRWYELIEEAGLPRIRIHDARHTHATLLLEQGESLKVLQERLGHEKVDVLLNTYSHLLPRMQRNAVDKFGSRLFRGEDN